MDFPDNSRIREFPGKFQGISGESPGDFMEIPGNFLGIRESQGSGIPGIPGIREFRGNVQGHSGEFHGIPTEF